MTENSPVSPGILSEAALGALEIKHEGEKLYRLRARTKATLSITFSLILILLLAYGASVLAEGGNGIPIFLEEEGSGLSLSENSEFSSPTTSLSVPPCDKLDCISVLSLPEGLDGMYSGSHNGENYIAYTFYLTNTDDETREFCEEMSIKSVTKHADEAVRVRIYRNGAETTYAKPNEKDESEFGTEDFIDDKTVCRVTHTLEKNEKIKFTIVIWIEGDDIDCENSIAGGSIRFSINFKTNQTTQT